MAMSLKIAAHCEIGLVRTNNQDSAYVSPSLIAVADGMGGAAAGDLASAVAINALRRLDEQHRPSPGRPDQEVLAGDQMLEALSGALTKANDELADLVAWDHSLEGMGTTVCGALFSGSQFGICHIGDSRGYLLRGGVLRHLTHDHSWVQSLVDDGKIAPEDAATHPHRSLLLKVLNGQSAHIPDFKLVDAKLGDRVLFCSDGLSGMVDDDVIKTLLTSGDDLDEIVAGLTEAAHEGGGLDNITLVVADVVEHDAALAAMPPEVLGAAATVAIPQVDRTVPIGPGIDTGAGQPGTGPEAAGPPGQPAPGIPAGVIDPDRFETIRYSPHLPSRGRRWLPFLTTILVILLVMAAGFFGGRAYLAAQYFIGPDAGRVAIFQGVPDQILDHQLWTKVETSPIRVTDLPPYYAGKVLDQELRYESLDDAREELAHLGRMAQRCIAERAAASPSPAAVLTEPASTPADATAADATPTDATATDATPGATPTDVAEADGTAGAAPGTTPGAQSPSVSSAGPAQQSGKPSVPASNRPDLEACG